MFLSVSQRKKLTPTKLRSTSLFGKKLQLSKKKKKKEQNLTIKHWNKLCESCERQRKLLLTV